MFNLVYILGHIGDHLGEICEVTFGVIIVGILKSCFGLLEVLLGSFWESL